MTISSQKKILVRKTFISFLLFAILFIIAIPAGAENPTCEPGEGTDGYCLLAPLTPDQTKPVDLGTYLATMFRIFIAVAGILATLMIIIAGFQYMMSEAGASKAEAKKKIWNAILGLLLALGSYAILNTINPELTKLNDLKLIVNEAAQKVEVVNFQIVEDIVGFKKQLFELLRQADPVNAMSWLWIAGCESGWTYNPAVENHSSNVPDPDGACGLFQMYCGCNGSSPRDCGKGDVATQVQNAIALFHERGPG